MKNIVILLVVLSLKAQAQYPLDIKTDYTWVIGYGSEIGQGRPWGKSILHFNGSGFDTSYHPNPMGYELWNTNTSLSDTAGNLICYTNGIGVYNTEHELIENGDSLNYNVWFEDYYDPGYPVVQGIAVLPYFDKNIAYFIYKPFLYYQSTVIHERLLYSKLNINQIKLTQKNKKIHADTLAALAIPLTRHANGRDWWLVQRKFKSARYWKYLVTPYNIALIDSQDIGIEYQPLAGQKLFSPDGTKYIDAGVEDFDPTKYHVCIFDFDRCTGTLSNPIHFDFTDSITTSTGAAISPNSRYLYFCSRTKIWQFDLQAPDILASKTTVAEYDGFTVTILNTQWQTPFIWMQLAPDNRIYIVAGSMYYYHVIENPNEAGIACNVNQHSFRLPTLNVFSIPNFPNYRLGPIDGSPCDTLGIDNLTNINDKLDNNTEPVQLYPNPAKDYITLFIPRITKQWQFALFNIQGREVLHVNSRGAFRSLDVSQLAAGLYLWKLVYEDGKEERGKVVKSQNR